MKTDRKAFCAESDFSQATRCQKAVEMDDLEVHFSMLLCLKDINKYTHKYPKTEKASILITYRGEQSRST